MRHFDSKTVATMGKSLQFSSSLAVVIQDNGVLFYASPISTTKAGKSQHILVCLLFHYDPSLLKELLLDASKWLCRVSNTLTFSKWYDGFRLAV